MTRGKIANRGEKRRSIKPVILIITEGAKSEPQYLNRFRNRHTNIDVRVVPNSTQGSKTDYQNLIRRAEKYAKDDEISSTNGDSVWVVADGDVDLQVPHAVEEKNRSLRNARSLAENKQIKLIISNPCFELWYLLHFGYTTRHFADFGAIKLALEQAGLSQYEKNADVFDKLTPHLEDAIQNAQRLEQFHVENGCKYPFSLDVNPFTDLYRLIQQLK